MVNFLYVLVAVAIFLVFTIIINSDFKQVLFVAFVICLMVYLGVPLMKDENVVHKINCEPIELSSEVGTFIVVSGTSWVAESEFILDSGTNIDELDEFIGKQSKMISTAIKRGDKYLWSYKLGLPENVSGKDVKDIYDTWIKEDKVPNTKVRYEFGCFYIIYG